MSTSRSAGALAGALRRFRRIVVLAGAICLATSPAFLPAEAPAGAGGAAESGEARFRSALDGLDHALRLAEEEVRAPGADPADVPAKAAALGHDPDRIFAFVRDGVLHEPYRGLLRGARGALACGAANSLDKSLLLRSLLETSGVSARLVKGTLDADRAGDLVDRFLRGRPWARLLPAAAPGGPGGDELAALAGSLELDPDLLAAHVAERAAESARFWESARSTAERQREYIEGHLRSAGVSPGRPAAAWREDLVGRVVEHFWVQAELPPASGTWVDLDPTIPGAERGRPTVEEFAPVDLEGLERHRLVFRLVHRALDGKDVREETILEARIDAADAFLERAAFSIHPADPLPSPEQLASMAGPKQAQLLVGLKKYQALLEAGGESYASRPFDLDGNLYDVAADGRMRAAGEVGGAVGGIFGGAFGGGDDEKKSPRRLVALAVTMALEGPGRTPRARERVLLSEGDLRADPFPSPILSWDLLLLGGPVSPDAAGFCLLSGAAQPFRQAVDLLEKGGVSVAAAARAVRPPSGLVSPVLLAWALRRQEALAAALAVDPALSLLWDAPTLAIEERRFFAYRREAAVRRGVRIDIVENPLGFLPSDDASMAIAAGASLRQGILDTVLEALLLEGAPCGGPAVSAAGASEAARLRGATLRVFGPEDDTSKLRLSLGADELAWIRAHEDPGRRILAPEGEADASGLRSVWWSLDPATGSILGRRAGGRGDASTEYNALINLISFHACMVEPIWDAASGKVQGGKAGAKITIKMLGCFVGMTLGFTGTIPWGETLKGNRVLAIWAGLTVGLELVDKILED